MRDGRYFRFRRTHAALCTGVIVAGMILVPSAGGRPLQAVPLGAFDSNGRDDSFLVAQSRPQGPVIKGSTATQSQAAAIEVAAGDPVAGSFGPQVAWPIMPIHAVLLPDGRVMSYGTDTNGVQTAFYQYDVWNPQLGTGATAHTVLPNGTATDIFCSSQLVLLNGNVELYGGDNLPAETNTQNRDVNQFRPAENTLVRTGSMNRLRWYSSATILPNAEVYIQGGTGGSDFPERRTSTGQFQLLTGASTSGLSSGYPKNFVGPDGLVFGIANQAMYRVNPAGTGSITSLGTFPTDNAGGTATSVMFAPGRILQVGGGNANAASRNASIIDINGPTPQVTGLPQVQYGRHWGNATVMADGRVFVSGGSAVNNAATGVAYTSEIFNPATSSWSTGPTATRMRLYHSALAAAPGRHRDHDGRWHAGSGDQPERRDLLPALPVQQRRHSGHAPDDHDRDSSSRSRHDPDRRHARRGDDLAGLVDQARLGDPLGGHGPALHRPALHQDGNDSAGDVARPTSTGPRPGTT